MAVVLRGGLGNQLFQFCAANGILVTGGGDPLLISYGSEWGSEHPDLASFLGLAIRYPDRMLRSTLPGVAVRESWKDVASSGMADVWGRLNGTILVKHTDPFKGRILPRARRYVLDGFFQNREWWQPAWRHVAKLGLSREPAVVSQLRRERRTVVKLRRSDYVGRGIVLQENFYREALTRLGVRNQQVTVICEDPEAVHDLGSILREFGCQVREPEALTGNVNIDDFWHLASARTLVLANSSYCWWAAAMACLADSEAVVAYPTPWLPNAWSVGPIPDMGLDGWIAIPARFA